MILVCAGSFEDMENVTVSSHCSLTIDHHEPTINEIERLDIKSYGEVRVITDQEATTKLKGLELDIRSGATVCEINFFSTILFL